MEFKKELVSFLDIAKRDQKAEVECKLLAGQIQTKDVADRILKAITRLSIGAPKETSLLRVMYPDNIRVEVEGLQHIQKVCVTSAFRGIPVSVQRKQPYHKESGQKDILDLPDFYTRFTLRFEEEVRKDWEASANDSRVSLLRIIQRRSYTTHDGFFQIDFSMVKSRKSGIRELLKEQHTYELEIEFVKRNTDVSSVAISESLNKIITELLKAFYESEFLLPRSAQEQYRAEFKLSRNVFYDIVTLTRAHTNSDRPHNILEGYTVTNKADGQRSGLYVARDKNVILLLDRGERILWSGIRALDDSHVGDFIDGEYIPEHNLFCIFDIYRYKGRDVKTLPLMKSDEDIVKNPQQSRLGVAKLFVEDLAKDFVVQPNNPMRIETKPFYAGDGIVMEQAIQQLLSMEYEYEIDGLIFTPRLSPVAPQADMVGRRWTRVYKWKPPTQNSIDFLLKLTGEETYDPVKDTRAKVGHLFVTRRPQDTILYPCETLTGEYVAPKLPEEFQTSEEIAQPAYFQPSSPKNPDAYKILVPIDEKGMYDQNHNRVEDNTIVECSYDLETRQWTIMRTRYDKTYKYRVKKERNFGNAVDAAENIWTSIHVPITEDMIKQCFSNKIDDTTEDDLYYNEDLSRNRRVLRDSYSFHRIIKESMYKQNIREGETLLELASGRGGDMPLWKRTKPSKVVGIEYAANNIKIACTRYLTDKRDKPTEYRPPVLYIKGDMTQPLFEDDTPHNKILKGDEKASTKYLEQFEDLTKFNTVSCQFAMHYACESEEIFRSFVRNITQHCKDTFFGTCSDGQSVYSLLLGKKTHIFTNGKAVGGEYTKQYDDREQWGEEFGLPVSVMLESFIKPEIEYLVPFKKITEIFEENGFELVETNLFSELYTRQTEFVLTPEEQSFSFLNRSFIFKRKSKSEKPETVEKMKDDSTPEGRTDGTEEDGAKAENGDVAKAESKKTRKLRKGGTIPEEEPVLFFGPGEDKGEFRAFSNMAEYPIEIDGVKYPTVEHYFQGMKAKEFADEEIYKKIVDCKTGKAVKALGKKVKNFAKEIWDAKRLEVMLRGVRAKFVQHPELQKQLLETGNRQIGEANPRDTFWGIGSGVESEKSRNPEKWRGQNKLGKMLMALRDDFKHE